MKFLTLFFLLFFIPLHAFSLGIDEKLTLRILKTSTSKKTVLINRGVEDGLQEGDHAKFFLTVGVVARGVVVKASPTRTVWALYRLVNADYIKDEQVMNLKITPAVKITKDDSKMLVSDDTPKTTYTVGDPRDLGIPLAEGADDLTEDDKLQSARRSDMNLDFGENLKDLKENDLEIFSTFSYSSLSTNMKTSTSDGYSAKDNATNVTIGGEYYFTNSSMSFMHDVSLGGGLAIGQRSLSNEAGETVQSNTSDYFGFVNLHFLRKPFETYSFLPFLHASMGMGNAKTEFTPGASVPSGVPSVSGTASSMIISFGGGLKYYTSSGLGARVLVDYYNRQDKFSVNELNEEWVKTQKGIRINLGLSYRF